jgi:hypothetical protein
MIIKTILVFILLILIAFYLLQPKHISGGKEAIKGYAYVPKELIPSIQKHGYLSVRKQVKLIPDLKDTIIRKYKTQFEEALGKYPGLKKIIAPDSSYIDKILKYLDWRDEKTLKGSNAIYFLFAPVPDDPTIHEFIKEYRGDFLKNRVLIELTIPNNYVIVHGKQNIDYSNKTKDWWKKQWYKVMKNKDPDQLWFEDIPHAYIVPKSGKIDPDFIKIR